jgi:hypothetical protein
MIKKTYLDELKEYRVLREKKVVVGPKDVIKEVIKSIN